MARRAGRRRKSTTCGEMLERVARKVSAWITRSCASGCRQGARARRNARSTQRCTRRDQRHSSSSLDPADPAFVCGRLAGGARRPQHPPPQACERLKDWRADGAAARRLVPPGDHQGRRRRRGRAAAPPRTSARPPPAVALPEPGLLIRPVARLRCLRPRRAAARHSARPARPVRPGAARLHEEIICHRRLDRGRTWKQASEALRLDSRRRSDARPTRSGAPAAAVSCRSRRRAHPAMGRAGCRGP